MSEPSGEGRDESQAERADRNFLESVQELRVAQTGVQILFAFLLSLAFYESFPVEDPTFAGVLTAALLSAAGATICFVAPVAFHRLNFRSGQKEAIVWVTHRMSMAGLVLLGAATALGVWLVLAWLWEPTTATWVAGGLAVVIVLLWGIVPSWALRGDDEAS